MPAGVEFAYDHGTVTVKGPKGELTQRVPREMIVSVADGVITVARPTDSAPHRSLHGLTRTLIANMVQGVTDGYEKRLEIVGVGYRASVKGADLNRHQLISYVRPGVDLSRPLPEYLLRRDRRTVADEGSSSVGKGPGRGDDAHHIRYALREASAAEAAGGNTEPVHLHRAY